MPEQNTPEKQSISQSPWETFTQESYDKLQNEWGKVWVAIEEQGWGWKYDCMEIDELKRVEKNNTHVTNIQIARINSPV